MKNEIHYGDNLKIMRTMPPLSIDLVITDPPYNSNRRYNVTGKDPQNESLAQIKAYDDMWCWNEEIDSQFNYLITNKVVPESVSTAMKALHTLLTTKTGKHNNSLAYCVSICIRLLEIHRLMREHASIYLMCDYDANYLLRIIMNSIFGEENFRNEIVWHYGLGGSSPKQWSSKHGTILLYSKTKDMYFIPKMVPAKSQRMKNQLKKMDDVWEFPALNNMALERVDLETQKPEELFEFMLLASSKEGDTILDPYMGSGTTCVVAQRNLRNSIGIDITHLLIDITESRLGKNNLGGKLEIFGRPEDIFAAKKLARDDPDQFELWVLSIIGYRKRKSDKGVDGVLNLRRSEDIYTSIAQVKSGQVTPSDYRDFAYTIDREKAICGIFLTLDVPTSDMVKIASEMGYVKDTNIQNSVLDEKGKIPKFQIITIEQLLNGQQPKLPYGFVIDYTGKPRNTLIDSFNS